MKNLKVDRWALSFSTEGYTTWCTHVGSLLKSVGMENIWDEQKWLVSVDNFKQLKGGLKNELENFYAEKMD